MQLRLVTEVAKNGQVKPGKADVLKGVTKMKRL